MVDLTFYSFYMKIGIDIRSLMDKQYSGVSSYTLNLVQNIIVLDKNNEYKFFYNSFSDINDRIPKFNESNVEIIKKNYPNKVLNYLFFKIFNYPKIDRLLEIDLFLMPHINFISLTPKCKSILTVHDLSFLRYPEFFSLRKNIWHEKIKVKKLVKKFNTIITVSKNTKNDLMELCDVPEKKIKVIYSGLEDFYHNLDYQNNKRIKQVKIKYNLPEKFILFLGNIEPRKNIQGLIQAYNILRKKNSNLKDYKLVLAGGPGWRQKEIIEEREKSEFKNDIIFLGYVDKEDKPYLYNLSSIFVFPSFYEGFGFPPLEAQASGTPVISSFSSSLPEILGNSALLIDPYNIYDLADSMEKVLSNQNLRKSLISAGKENIKRFNWKNTAEEYMRLLRALK